MTIKTSQSSNQIEYL